MLGATSPASDDGGGGGCPAVVIAVVVEGRDLVDNFFPTLLLESSLRIGAVPGSSISSFPSIRKIILYTKTRRIALQLLNHTTKVKGYLQV